MNNTPTCNDMLILIYMSLRARNSLRKTITADAPFEIKVVSKPVFKPNM
jgi:hypothetical protein